MSQLSCANCWHNPLQYDLIGDEIGYCVWHRVVLRRPEATTCGRLLRKDFTLPEAEAVQQRHADQFDRGDVSTLHPEARRHLPVWVSTDTSALQADAVRAAVVDYGALGTKIESLTQLNTRAEPPRPDSVRAEIAMLSLARGYVRNCVREKGHWTSGVHLAWWLGKRLLLPPKIDLRDLRRSTELAVSRERLERLLDLAGWSVLMLRLLFLDDLARHEAADVTISTRFLAPLLDLPEHYALKPGRPSLKGLLGWMKQSAAPAFQKALPRSRYDALARELHRPSDAA